MRAILPRGPIEVACPFLDAERRLARPVRSSGNSPPVRLLSADHSSSSRTSRFKAGKPAQQRGRGIATRAIALRFLLATPAFICTGTQALTGIQTGDRHPILP